MHIVEKILNNTTPYGKIRASHEGSLHSSTLTADLKVICLHGLLKTVGNSVSNVQIGFISSDLLRSLLFVIIRFGLFQLSTLACNRMNIHACVITI